MSIVYNVAEAKNVTKDPSIAWSIQLEIQNTRSMKTSLWTSLLGTLRSWLDRWWFTRAAPVTILYPRLAGS